MFRFEKTRLEGVYVIDTQIKSDERGFLSRLYCKEEFKKIGFEKEFVQENITNTVKKGSFRGFHFQIPPFSESKLIRCIRGRVLDIIIDIRKASPTFLHSITVNLSSDKLNMVYAPEGTAHGFQTLEDNCIMLYLHTNYYHPDYEMGINVYDSRISIELPLKISSISEKDRNLALLNSNFEGLIV